MRAFRALRPPSPGVRHGVACMLALLAALVLWPTHAHAAPATLVSHTPGSTINTGDAGLGTGTIPFGEFMLVVPLRFYAMARDSGDVVFSSAAGNLAAGQVDTPGLAVYHWNRATGVITLVSHAHFSTTTSCSGAPSLVSAGGISADGRYVVYMSECSDLDPDSASDANGSAYLWDRDFNVNTLVSKYFPSPGVVVGLPGLYPAISDDGSFIYYRGLWGDGSFGLAEISGGGEAGILADRVFLFKSMVTHVAGSPGTEAAGSMDPRNRALSADGRYVVYSSNADNLVAGQVASLAENLFIYDSLADVSQLVTHAVGSPATPASAGSDDNFELSPNGSGIAFSSDGGTLIYGSRATNLIAGFVDSNGTGEPDLYAYTRATGVNVLVTHSAALAAQGTTGFSGNPAISANGSRVAYSSAGTDLIAGQITTAPGVRSLLLWDAGTNSSRMVSHAAASTVTDAGGRSWKPAIDSSGSIVAYSSTGSTMIAGLVNADSGFDMFHWTESTDATVLVSRSAASALTTDNGTDSISAFDYPLMNGTGSLVLFPSNGTDLVAGQTDTNSDADLFLFEAVAPTVSFAAAASAVAEGAGASITVQLSTISGSDVTVPFTVGGSAANPADFSVISASPLTIPAGSLSATIDLTTANDALDESAETVVLTLGAPVNAILGAPGVHTLTINDDDLPPTLQFSAAGSSAGEGVDLVITLELSAPSGLDISVPFVAAGSATSPADYGVTTASPRIIPAGSTGTTIAISTVADGASEGDESVTFSLGSPTNATLGANASHTLTIVDGAGPPVLSFALASSNAEEGGGGTVIQLTLSAPATVDVVVPFSLSGSAAGVGDYIVPASPLVIPAGAVSASLTIDAVDDALAEPAETVVIALGAPSNATLGSPASHTLTLADDDAPPGMPTVNFVATQTTLTEGFETSILVELEEPATADVLVEFIATSVHGEPGAAPDDFVLHASPIVIPAGQTQGVITLLALHDTLIEVDECMLLRLQVSVNSVPGPRSDSLIVIHSQGGAQDQGGAFSGWLWLLPLLARRRLRRAIVGALATAGLCAITPLRAAGPDGVQPYLVQPQGRDWWTHEDYFAIALGSDPAVLTDQFMLELDAIDVTPMTTRSQHGLVLVLRPVTRLKPGMHRLRLVRQTPAGEMLELASWEFELRRSEGFRSAGYSHATALQGTGAVLSSEDIDSKRDYNGNGSVRLDGAADTGLAQVNAHANLLTTSNALRTHQDEVQLGDFKLSGTDGDTQIVAGNHAVAAIGGQSQRDFAYDGGSRRGVSLSTRLPTMSATVTAYSLGSEPVNGFYRGLAFSRSGSRFTGGLLRALPYAAGGNQVGMSLGYIRGTAQRGGTAIYSAEEGAILQTPGVDGNVGNAVLDTRWLSGALSFRAEYASSERHFPLIRGVQLDPVTDDAQSYVLSYQAQEGVQLGEHALTGHITLDHQEIGTAFRSVAAPGGVIDVAQNRASAGLQYHTLSLDLSGARSEDNVAGAPFPTTRATNLGVQLSWSPQFDEGRLPSFLQQPSLSVGAGNDRRQTAELPPDTDPSQRVDSDSRNLATSLTFVQPLGGWSLSYSAGTTDDGTGQSQGTRNQTASLDANFQLGSRVNLTTQLFTDVSEQLSLVSDRGTEFESLVAGSNTRTLSSTLGLAWQVIPNRWNLTLGYAANRARAGDGSLESRSQQADFNSTWVVWKFNLFLRGSYQYASERSLLLPYEDEFGELSPPEFQGSRRESYQAFAGFSFNFRGGT